MKQMNTKIFNISPSQITNHVLNNHLENSFGKFHEKTLSQIKDERRSKRNSNQSDESFDEQLSINILNQQNSTTMNDDASRVELNNNFKNCGQKINDRIKENNRSLDNEHIEQNDNELTSQMYNSTYDMTTSTIISDTVMPISTVKFDADAGGGGKRSINGVSSFVPIESESDDRPKRERRKSSIISNANVQRFRTLKGISLAFFSSIFFSLTTVIVKYVEDVHAGQMACFRFLGILLFTLPILIESKENPFGPPHLRHWVILRGVAGASSIYFRYSALHYLPIADATVIVLSMPVFVCIFAKVFLKEPCGIFHIISLAVTLIGIAFTTKLNIIFGSSEKEVIAAGIDRKSEILGLLCGMGATLVGSSAYVIVRKVRHLHHSVILFNFSWVAIIETSIITYFLNGFKFPDCGIEPWLLVILAVLSFYGQLMLTKALQAEEAGLVSVTRASAEVIFAFIFQISIFHQMPDLWSILGAFLVTISVLLTSSRKWVLTLPKESKVRKALNFVTK